MSLTINGYAVPGRVSMGFSLAQTTGEARRITSPADVVVLDITVTLTTGGSGFVEKLAEFFIDRGSPTTLVYHRKEGGNTVITETYTDAVLADLELRTDPEGTVICMLVEAGESADDDETVHKRASPLVPDLSN